MAERTGSAPSVKNAPRLSVLGADAIDAGKPKEAAAFTADHHDLVEARRQPGQYMGLPAGAGGRARHQHVTQAGVVARGPFIGLPKRRATDRTKSLAPEQVQNVVNAFDFSEKNGRPLNNGLTAAWECSLFYDGTPESWARCQTKLQDVTTRWLKRQGVETELVWVRERADGRGAHSHFMFNCPVMLRKPLRDHLNATFKFRKNGLALDRNDIGMQTPAMRAGHLLYILKGIDHAAFVYRGFETVNIGAALGIDHRGQQGRVEIKRAGCSRNIDAAARKRAGWQDLRDLPALYRALHPAETPREMRRAA